MLIDYKTHIIIVKPINSSLPDESKIQHQTCYSINIEKCNNIK